MSKKSFWTAGICALAVMIVGASAIARADKLSNDDKDAIKNSMRNMETIAQECRLARNNASADSVQHYAELTLKDYSRMIDELHDIANKYDYKYDADPTRPDVQEKKELEKLKGAEFDRVFMSAQVREQEEMLNMFKTGAKTDQTDLRHWFDKNQDTVKTHLDNGRELYSKVKNKETEKKH